MDKYDEAIKYLTKFPKRIHAAWFAPPGRPRSQVRKAHCLFQYVTPNGKYEDSEGKTYRCGCLTQIRAGGRKGFTPNLTKDILEDERIPTGPCDITLSNLPVFAEWHRRLDKELGRN